MGTGESSPKGPESTLEAPRAADAIYQNGRFVGRVIAPRVDLGVKEIRFEEVHNSDYLMLPDECEFDRYAMVVKRVGFASKIERGAEHKGRVLKEVVAEILRYLE